MRKKRMVINFFLIFLFLGTVKYGYSHCQVPCGIYNDEMRMTMMAEHITTMEKAMKQVIELSSGKMGDFNQIVRWITNKELHAEEMSQIITYYFMAQRIKPVFKKETKKYKEYVIKLELLHHLLVYTMKAKQTTDLDVIKKLRVLLGKFKKVYFNK
jgi:nickel superoxide dismutase